MICNGFDLLTQPPIKDMESNKINRHGVSHGLSEAGYDIRIKQKIEFSYHSERRIVMVDDVAQDDGRFVLASAIEEFQMPDDLVGIVHDKSTWARKGLSVFNTVIEPGFRGGLTLELVYHGNDELIIPAGAGIAQVVFHKTSDNATYTGKYQFQSTDPEPARDS